MKKTTTKSYPEKETYENDLGKKTQSTMNFDEIVNQHGENEKLIDMHTHTNYSDGEYSPEELIELAVKNNIGTLGITDHNTIAGIKTVDKKSKLVVSSGIQIIDGMELSAKTKRGRMHILGYDLDLNSEELNKKMSLLKDNSMHSTLSIMEQLKKDYDIRFGYEDIRNMINANHNLGSPDLANLCVKYGYAKTIQEAFDKYLVAAHDKTRGSEKILEYPECIELIKVSGGLPVLAHPKSLKLDKDDFIRLLEKMIDCGLVGLEVYHSSHSKEEMDYYLEVANKYNLLVSGGSDYHGPFAKPDIELGKGRGNIKIKQLSLLDEINRRRL